MSVPRETENMANTRRLGTRVSRETLNLPIAHPGIAGSIGQGGYKRILDAETPFHVKHRFATAIKLLTEIHALSVSRETS